MSVGSVAAGRLRHRVTIQKNGTATRNAYGELEPTSWVDVASVYAEVRQQSGTESTDADRVAERITHHVVVQYREGITAAMRIVWQNKVLNIRHVQDLHGMHRGMLLLCEQDAGEVAA